MKLYFHPFSGNSRRVLLVVEHLQIAVERVQIDLPAGEQKSAAHVARNPNGRVPVLEDDGLVLWESRAIMEYLTDQTPGQTLMPTDARGRADVHRWMFWDAAHLAPAATIIVLENFVKSFSKREPDPAEVARGEAQLVQFAAVLDAHLADHEWVAQGRLTLADLSLAAGFALAGPARFPIQPFAHLRAWLARVAELESWKRTQPQLGR